jgi:hypothetical protein
MAKILEREFNRFEELSSLLEAIPNSYLAAIDFQEAALSAMVLTDKLITQASPAPLSYGPEGPKVTRGFITINSIPGGDEISNLRLEYEPCKDEERFYETLVRYLAKWTKKTKKINYYPPTCTKDGFNDVVLPWIRKRAKDGKYKILSDVSIEFIANEVALGKPTVAEEEQPPK